MTRFVAFTVVYMALCGGLLVLALHTLGTL
jgi:hypothetical protein